MNVEEWKNSRSSTFKEDVSFRGLQGLRMTEGSYSCEVYYPTEFLKEIDGTFNQFTIGDVYYDVYSNQETTKESLYLNMILDSKKVTATVSLFTEEGYVNWDFDYYYYRTQWKSTKDIQKTLFIIFIAMEQFIKENSPNRLQLVTSSSEESLPVWIKGMKHKQKG